jgi:sugar phosphate permease
VLRRLLAISALTGVVLSTLELLGPLRFADLAGGPTSGSAVFGIVTAVSFGAAGLGAALAGPARRTARGSTAATTAALAAVGALAVAGTALSASVLPAAAAYALFYLVGATSIPLRGQLLHSRVPAERRTTSVSVTSFAMMIGGVGGSLLVPRLAEASSSTAAFLAAAAVLVGIALVSLRLPTPTPGLAAGAPAAGEPQRSKAVG